MLTHWPKIKEGERKGKCVKKRILGYIPQEGLYMKPLVQILTSPNTSDRFWCRKLILNLMNMITRTVYWNNYYLSLEFFYTPSQQKGLDSSLGNALLYSHSVAIPITMQAYFLNVYFLDTWMHYLFYNFTLCLLSSTFNAILF